MKALFLITLLLSSFAFAKREPSDQDKLLKGGGYVTYRGLDEYLIFLPKEFSPTLAALKKEDVWLDSGAGNALAQVDYLNRGGVAKCVAIDRFFPKEKAAIEAIKNFPSQFLFLFGRYLHGYEQNELPSAKLITDFYGAISYTNNVDSAFSKLLNSLTSDGILAFVAAESVEMDQVQVESDTLLIYQDVQGARKYLPVRDWYKAFSGVEWLEQRNRSGLFRRTTGHVTVPPLELISYDDSIPPKRIYRWK